MVAAVVLFLVPVIGILGQTRGPDWPRDQQTFCAAAMWMRKSVAAVDALDEASPSIRVAAVYRSLAESTDDTASLAPSEIAESIWQLGDHANSAEMVVADHGDQLDGLAFNPAWLELATWYDEAWLHQHELLVKAFVRVHCGDLAQTGPVDVDAVCVADTRHDLAAGAASDAILTLPRDVDAAAQAWIDQVIALAEARLAAPDELGTDIDELLKRAFGLGSILADYGFDWGSMIADPRSQQYRDWFNPDTAESRYNDFIAANC